MSKETKKSTLYYPEVTLTTSVEIRQAKTEKGDKPYAYAKATTKGGKALTIMTYVKAGIAALTGAQEGETLRLYGTYEQSDDNKIRTFSAMGISQERPAPAATPEV